MNTRRKTCPKCNRLFKITRGGYTHHVQKCKAEPQPKSVQMELEFVESAQSDRLEAAFLKGLLTYQRENNLDDAVSAFHKKLACSS